MSLSHHLRRNQTSNLRRLFSTTTTPTTPTTATSASIQPSHHKTHMINHEFLPPTEYINSWKSPNNPKEAQSQLARLRREYEKHLKVFRKNYIHEMEMQRLEKLRKDEAKKEAQRIANEARKAAKAAEKKAKAKERELADKEFRQTLLKERAEKLEYWREREKKVEEKKIDARELTRRKSSMWIDEAELEKKLLEKVVQTSSLF